MIDRQVRARLRAFLLSQATLAAVGGISLAAEGRTEPAEKLILGFEKAELGRSQFVGREVKGGPGPLLHRESAIEGCIYP